MSELATKTEKLKKIVQQLESVVVAYSGGVDSTLYDEAKRRWASMTGDGAGR